MTSTCNEECKNSPTTYECKMCCHDVGKTTDWKCGHARTKSEAEDMCSAMEGDRYNGYKKDNCKGALLKRIGRCSYNKGTNDCSLRVYYPDCDNLKKGKCRAAVSFGVCQYRSGTRPKKGCKDL